MKRLALFFDGTWKKADAPGGRNTNVARLARAVRCQDAQGTYQIVFYDTGVGTGNLLDRLFGGAIGLGLDENVQDGYRFLANNYEPGDEIYIFGYSRGAFTARSLAGLIRTVGILKKAEMEHAGEAWDIYRTPKSERSEATVAALRALATTDVPVKCVGVWDTVGSLGIPGDILRMWSRKKYAFHDTQLGGHIEFAFHAVGIDEKRGPFAPTLWTGAKGARRAGVEQVWFPGVHGNIGGGGPHEGLANITLRWMADRVMANTGLALDDDYLLDRCPVMPESHLDTVADNLKFPYWFSKLVPFQRLIGYSPAPPAGLWYRVLKRYSRPDDDFPEAINEMLHWAAARRFEEMAAYRAVCPSLARALEEKVRICTEDDQRAPYGGKVSRAA